MVSTSTNQLPSTWTIAIAVGLVVSAESLRRMSRSRTSPTTDERQSALTAYLRDHLSGADTAYLIVKRLRSTHAGTPEGRLFESLYEQFQEERAVVRGLLARIGASPISAKRVAGQVSGSVLKLAAGGSRGDLSLFRTLESLAIGVQGKRCLWRALQAIDNHLVSPGPRSFAELESMAVHQWVAIEERRRALALETFAVVSAPARA
jgi:hypothetical protein